MSKSITEQLQENFWETVTLHENSKILKEAALEENLGDWTKALTNALITTCEAMGWTASAIGHQLDALPIQRNEYLSLDMVAVQDDGKRWPFPIAVFELENSMDNDKIAYSLWKVLCVRATIRAVFCYRRSSDEASELVKFLKEKVINSMDLKEQMKLEGQTLVIVGSRDDSSTFPYGFFKWWKLEKNTGVFRRT